MSRKSVEKNISYDDDKKLFYVTFDYGKNVNGIREKNTKTYRTKAEAKKALKIFDADKAQDILLRPTSDTLENWLSYWMLHIKSRNCAVATIYGYNNIINNHIVPSIGQNQLQKLTAQDINKYFTSLEKKGLTINSIRKHYDLLKDSLNKAVDEEKIIKNPLSKIVPPKAVKSQYNFYSIEQLQTLFDIVKDDRMEIVVKLAGYLGLRRGEIDALKWDKVDFENKKLYIDKSRSQAGKNTTLKDPKSSSSNRILAIPDELVNTLKRVKLRQDSQKEVLLDTYNDEGYVMAWENGNPYRPNYLSDLFKKIIDDNNLTPIRLHDLRHSFASIANDLGIPMFDIGKALGHSSLATTSGIYTHAFEKTNYKAINTIADSINKCAK